MRETAPPLTQKQLGQAVGNAYVIREEEADTPGYTTGFGSGNGAGNGSDGDHNFDLRQPTTFAREITFSLGKITVEEKIYVTFELMM